MSTTMDQVQQLSGRELCIACHNYNIASYHIANLGRRQLERRLHVAIVGERAKWRAHRFVFSFQDEQQSGHLNDWANNERLRQDEYRLLQPEWHYRAMREQAMRLAQRYSGGDEQQSEEEEEQSEEEIEQLVQLRQPEYVAKQLNNRQIQPLTCNKYVSQPQMQEKPLQQSPKITFQVTESPIAEYYTDTSTEYLTLDSSSLESRTSLDIDCPSLSVNPCPEYQLQKAEQLTLWKFSAQSKTEPDSLSEQELCTVNYLSQEQQQQLLNENHGQLLKQLSRTELLKDLESIGDTLTGQQRLIKIRPRPAFWRYILNKLCCDSRGKLDCHKLRYSILCCAMVVCTYVGVKMLQ